MLTCCRRQILPRGDQVVCTAENFVSLTILLLTIFLLTVLSLTDLLLTVLSPTNLVASTVLSDVDGVPIRAAVNPAYLQLSTPMT